jgi:GNAT superfamily N-acetyltransferase
MKLDIEFTSKEIFFDFFNKNRSKVFGNTNEFNVNLLLTQEEFEKMKLNTEMYEKRKGYYLLAKYQDEIIGWSFGVQRSHEDLYMVNSAVFESFRRRGFYTQILAAALEKCKEMGFLHIYSNHRFHNAQVLIPKLKLGFIISGFTVSPAFGSLVQLSYYTNEEVKKAFLNRLGYEPLTDEMKEKLGL